MLSATVVFSSSNVKKVNLMLKFFRLGTLNLPIFAGVPENLIAPVVGVRQWCTQKVYGPECNFGNKVK